MRQRIIDILERCKYKGNFVQILKKSELWLVIENNHQSQYNLTDVEKVYLYLHPDTRISCESNYKKKYLGLTRGYSNYCSILDCESCNAAKLQSIKNGVISKYGVDNIGKLPAAIKSRKDFWSDPKLVAESQIKRKNTSLKKYGTDNPASSQIIKDKTKQKFIDRYGVDNPSKVTYIKQKKIDTCLKNYGVQHPMQAKEIREKTKQTNIRLYGVAYPTQNKTISEKGMATKMLNGGFDKSNSSKEATSFIRNYINDAGYHIDQCAYADIDIGLHEWGIYSDGRWTLFDLVVFELGHRGNKEKIIEILEYHGPFHYTEEEAKIRGEEQAYPWKTNKTTIFESYNRDIEKESLAKSLTSKFTVIRTRI